MDNVHTQIHISKIDEERFGIRTAKASNVTTNSLPAVLDFCREHQVSFLIARSLTTEIKTAQAMEREGFQLMDTLIYYSRNLIKSPIPDHINQETIRFIKPGEEAMVKKIAAESFRGYMGHYHSDDKLDPVKCDQVYISWASRSCVDRNVADDVFIAEIAGSIVGFATLKKNNSEEGEGVLFGILPSAQRLGVYRSFVIMGMHWCLSKTLTRMIFSTQITNIAVQKVWVRLGFEPTYSFYTFHKWFN
jgi:hypothetical protein